MYKAFLLMFALVLLAACGARAESGASGGARPNAGHAVVASQSELLDTTSAVPRVGEPAPDFAFTLPDGTATRLSDLRGKPVLLNFWATWCGPCEEELPDLQRVHQQDESLVILGINKGEALDVIAPYVEEKALTFPIVPDPQSDIAHRYGVRNIPTSFFIDANGTIRASKLGIMDYTFITQEVEKLQ